MTDEIIEEIHNAMLLQGSKEKFIKNFELTFKYILTKYIDRIYRPRKICASGTINRFRREINFR